MGVALDAAAAQCMGVKVLRTGAGKDQKLLYVPKRSAYLIWTPSTNWKQGGPIVDRLVEAGAVLERDAGGWPSCRDSATGISCRGTTPLMAAVRCFVLREMGTSLDLPDALLV
jgi:hypothetical protein